MSHSTVLVIGKPDDDLTSERWIAEALAPFDENVEVEPYRDYVNPLPEGWEQAVANGERFRALQEAGMGHREAWSAVWGERNTDPLIPSELFLAIEHGIDPRDLSAVAAFVSERWGEEYAVDDRGLYTVSTYNPRSRWDWWELGGRWSGFFKLREDGEGYRGKPGSMGQSLAEDGVDLARKGDIAWEAMLADSESRAEKAWDEAQQRDPGFRHVLYDVKDGETRGQYIKRNTTIATFAVLKDGEWFERGRMERRGVVSDEQDTDVWKQQWMGLVMGLPDDTPLAVCDVHI